MTLLGLATYGDHAEFITDTASYTHRVTHMGSCTKHLALPHLDAAVLSQGNSRFGDVNKAGLLQISSVVASFDELAAIAPEQFQGAWQAVSDEQTTDSLMILLGYSTDLERFVAYGYASEDGFERFEIEGLWLTPSPWTLRMPPTELGRFRRYIEGRPDTDELIASVTSRPAGKVPASTAEWVALACRARGERSMHPFGHVIVAGKVLHTRLARGEVHTRQVHDFNDSGPEFLRLVASTHHPLAQVGACFCGSGLRSLDCHLADELDDPCGCRSGKVFKACCMVGNAR